MYTPKFLGAVVSRLSWVLPEATERLVLNLGDKSSRVEEYPCLHPSVAVGDAVCIGRDGVIKPFTGDEFSSRCTGVVTKVLDNQMCEITCNGLIRNFSTGMRPGAKMYISDETPGKLTDEEPYGTHFGHLVGVALSETDLVVITA